MSLALYDRVRETTTVLGTNDAVLLGAVTGYQSFAAVGNANTCYYTISDSAGNWEVGLGTYNTTGPTLARTTVYASSNSNLKVNFPAGTKDIFLTYPAEKAVALDTASSIAAGSMLYGNGTTSFTSLPVGTNGQVLTLSGGLPTWANNGNGTVTSVDVSGGTTGLTTSGGPITSSGTITLAGTLATTNGGTGLTSLTAGSMVYGAGTSAYSTLAIGTNGYILQSNGTAPTWVNPTTVVGGAGGANTQVQYNNSGALAGSANMTFNGTSLTLANDATIHGLTVGLGGGAVATNMAVGTNALAATATGVANTAVGSSTLNATTTGAYNTAIGYFSNNLNADGQHNTSIGYRSLNLNVSGNNNTALGDTALNHSTVSNNTAVGTAALYTNTTGTPNTAVGYTSMYYNTTGANNIAVGDLSLQANTTGNANTALGSSALYSNTTASNNTAVGYQAGYSNTTGYNNFFGGYQAGYTNTTGTRVVALGYQAGYLSSVAADCLYVGPLAGYNATGGGNTFVGANAVTGFGAGYAVTSGNQCTILGGFSGNQGGLDIRTASNYIVLSDGAGNPRQYYDNARGGWTLTGDALINGLTVGLGGGAVSQNTAIGVGSIAASATGNYNTSVGYNSLNAVTSGDRNTAVGWLTMLVNTTGSENVAVGGYALGYNVTGSYNTAIGRQALTYNTADNNTGVGYQAGYNNITGTGNTSVGYLAMTGQTGQSCSYNTAVGNSALNVVNTGSNNVAVGYQSLNFNTTASNNTAVGYQAGYSNTTGAGNVLLGYGAGYTNTVNSFNTCLGTNSGYLATGANNTFVGIGSGQSVTTGGNNTIIGGYTGNLGGLDIRTASNYIVLSDGAGNVPFYVNAAVGLSFFGALDNNATNGGMVIYGGPNGTFTLGHASGAASGSLYAAWTYAGGMIGSVVQVGTTSVVYNTTSDYRLKENPTPVSNGLDTIKCLNPVDFTWSDDGRADTGFLAHEFQAVIPNSVVGEKDAVDEEGNPIYQQMDNSGAVPFLVAAIQELSAKNDALEARIAALEAK